MAYTEGDPVSTSAKTQEDPNTTWAVRYWSLNAVGADPSDENSWSEFAFVVESQIEAQDLFDQYSRVYADNPDIRDLQMVKVKKIKWDIHDVDPKKKSGKV